MENSPRLSMITRTVVVVTTTFVIFTGITTLLGLTLGDFQYTVPDFVPAIGGTSGTLPTGTLAFIFVRLAVITIAFAIIIGIVNLIAFNAQRSLRGQTLTARLNSGVVLIFFILGIITPVVAPTFNDFLLEDVQTTLESSLAALIFFTLVYGGFRILKNKVTISGIIFVLIVEIILIGALPVAAFAPIRQVTDWLIDVPVNAGARGILLGIALATLITGLRVLIGQDRSYGE